MALDSFDELLRQLRSRPEWQEQLRVVVLTEEVLALPGQMSALTERVDTLAQLLGALAERVDALPSGWTRWPNAWTL